MKNGVASRRKIFKSPWLYVGAFAVVDSTISLIGLKSFGFLDKAKTEISELWGNTKSVPSSLNAKIVGCMFGAIGGNQDSVQLIGGLANGHAIIYRGELEKEDPHFADMGFRNISITVVPTPYDTPTGKDNNTSSLSSHVSASVDFALVTDNAMYADTTLPTFTYNDGLLTTSQYIQEIAGYNSASINTDLRNGGQDIFYIGQKLVRETLHVDGSDDAQTKDHPDLKAARDNLISLHLKAKQCLLD